MAAREGAAKPGRGEPGREGSVRYEGDVCEGQLHTEELQVPLPLVCMTTTSDLLGETELPPQRQGPPVPSYYQQVEAELFSALGGE
jgi:hypothetical protein